MKELKTVVRAIGSFVFTCIVFAIPIGTAFILKTKQLHFLGVVLLLISIAEFVFTLFTIYFDSGED
jgi:hypothetical protein